MTWSERTLGRVPTRAERVRARRARQASQVEFLRSTARRKPRPKARPRRRFDFALPGELGVEVSMSALPLPRFKTRLLTVVLLGLSIWGLNDVMRATSFRVGEAAVMGASLFTPAQIRSLAAVEGKPVFLVNPQEVHSQLMRQAEVESAQVSVRWPNQVRIQVKERRPVVAWIEDGKTWWLSADGVAFLEHGDWPGLIRVESSERALEINDDPTSPAIVPDVIDTAIALASLVPQADRLFFDRGQGLGFRDPGGWLVYFGTSGDMAQKFRLYQTLRESLTAIGRPVTQVSVADPTAPYYR